MVSWSVAPAGRRVLGARLFVLLNMTNLAAAAAAARMNSQHYNASSKIIYIHTFL